MSKKNAFIADHRPLLRMDIKVKFRGFYANHAERVSFFAKLLIQKFYGGIMYLASKPHLNLANGMESAGIRYFANWITFAFPASLHHQKTL